MYLTCTTISLVRNHSVTLLSWNLFSYQFNVAIYLILKNLTFELVFLKIVRYFNQE